jgi:NAD(P)-dependent dehydrogenase (short-subunit alcohol dehydrogenase family)
MHDRQVALVTGANQGIGLQIAKDLVAHGFTVLVGSRNLEHGEIAAKEIGPDAHAVQLDVTDQVSITAAADRVRKLFGRLDVLIQNAAISNTNRQPGQSIQDYVKTTRPSNVSLSEMRAVWDTNVFGVLSVYQAMLPLLRETPGARIERRWVAHDQLGPGVPLPCDFRPCLFGIQDGAQRLDGRHGG